MKRKISNIDRKEYNKYIERHNIDEANANGALPFVLIGFLGLAYLLKSFASGYISIGCVAIALIVAIVSGFNRKSDIEKHL